MGRTRAATGPRSVSGRFDGNTVTLIGYTHGRVVHITDALRVATFGGVSAFPIRVAERMGWPADHGLRLSTTNTTDSSALRDDLLAGRVEIAHAAPDNVFAWADAAGAGTEPTVVVVWLAGSNGPISLVSRTPGPIAALSGARIGVDAPTSGFAPILFRLLARAGLTSQDAELVPLGATRGRYAALLEGRVDASMLTLPWSTLAVAAGCHLLGDHASVTPGLLTSAAIVRRDWLTDHAAVADRYRAMLARALTWLRDPGSRDTAVAWLADDLALDTVVASHVLAAMADPAVGWPTAIDLDPHALDTGHAARIAIGMTPTRAAAEYLVTA